MNWVNRRAGRDLESFSMLISGISEASLEPQRWEGIINTLMDAIGATSGQMFTPMSDPDSGGFFISCNIPDTFIQQYVAKWQPHDLWTQACAAKGYLGSGTVVTDEDLISRKTLLTSPFYRELLKPANASRICVSMIFGPEATGARVTTISGYRPVGARPFTESAKTWMRLLDPHISRALGITYRLQDARFQVATTRAALDRIQSGILLIDSVGAASFLNRAAMTLLSCTTSIGLRRGRDGRDRLVARHPTVNKSLQDAVDNALRLPNGSVDHFSTALHVLRGDPVSFPWST